MLAISGANGLFLFKSPGTLAADVAADVTIAGPQAVLAPGGADRLVVARTNALLRYDGIRAATSTTAPAVTVPLDKAVQRAVSVGDAFFTNEGLGNIAAWPAISTWTSASTPRATFVHPFDQIPGIAYDAKGDHLFGGQISGAGTLVWNAASTKTGSVTHDTKLADGAYWTMTVADDRLYAAGNVSAGVTGVGIWPSASTLGAPTAPITLTNGYTNGFVSHVVVNNDTLVVAARDQKAIMIYREASKITADQAPTFTLTPATRPELTKPVRLAVDAKNRLYVTDEAGGVLVFADIATNPTFVTKLTKGFGMAYDLALVD